MCLTPTVDGTNSDGGQSGQKGHPSSGQAGSPERSSGGGSSLQVREGYFMCETSKICISKQLLCDGHVNCGFDTFGSLDTSDEKC